MAAVSVIIILLTGSALIQWIAEQADLGSPEYQLLKRQKAAL